MGMLNIESERFLNTEAGISTKEMVGLPLFSAFCQGSDDLAEKTWKVYNAKDHNRLVTVNYQEVTGPEIPLDKMIVKSVIETPNYVKVYAS